MKTIETKIFIWLLIGCWYSLAFTATRSSFRWRQLHRPSRLLLRAQDPDSIRGNEETIGFNQLKISFVTGNEMKVSLIFRRGLICAGCLFSCQGPIDSRVD